MDTIDKELQECALWSDDELTTKLAISAQYEREGLVSLLIRLGEFTRRSLPEAKGYSSAYDYCMRKLAHSRTAAARRVLAAKAARKYPAILRLLCRGELHLTTVAMLYKHLSPANYEDLLRQASGKSEDEVDRLIASIAPRPIPKERIVAVRAHARSAPTPSPLKETPAAAGEGGGSHAGAFSDELFAAPSAAEPPAESLPEVYDVRFPADAETVALIRRAKEVLRHKFPAGETGSIVKHALRKLLAEVDRDLRKPKKSRKPAVEASGDTRHIPEAVKQEAWDRYGGQCAFIADDGTRCTARAWLEFDHEMPYAKGGSSTDPKNIRPYCWPHNKFAARREFGDQAGPPT